jgi:AcrR family transcriptional regulator
VDIADMATTLFVERGYHEVTTTEIAKLANVSVPTLFNYFPTKESLVFDEGDRRERQIIDAVVSRKKGGSILDKSPAKGVQKEVKRGRSPVHRALCFGCILQGERFPHPQATLDALFGIPRNGWSG